MRWTALIASRNRRSVLERTLARLPASVHAIVIDNASTDGTAQAAAAAGAEVIRLDRNRGPVAKSLGLERVGTDLVLALDDDASVGVRELGEMARRFDADPRLGGAGFAVTLPGGQRESAALPGVFVGAACAFRADALRDAGGWDLRFFMAAEEYDLAFRLASLGWRTRVFDDLPALHEKCERARNPRRVRMLDARNNARLCARWLPDDLAHTYARCWSSRYAALSHRPAASRAASAAGWTRGRMDRRDPLDAVQIERFFEIDAIERAMCALRDADARRILLARVGKNLPAFTRAVRRAGLDAVAIADDHFCELGMKRADGVPVIRRHEALSLGFDCVVVADSARPFAHAEAQRWRDNGFEAVAMGERGAAQRPVVEPFDAAGRSIAWATSAWRSTLRTSGVSASAPGPAAATST